jgi:hypothetical protein
LRTIAESITIVGGEATLVDVHGAKTQHSLLPEFLARKCFKVANVANPPRHANKKSSKKLQANKRDAQAGKPVVPARKSGWNKTAKGDERAKEAERAQDARRKRADVARQRAARKKQEEPEPETEQKNAKLKATRKAKV